MENQNYPEHCKGCHKLAECKQKVFMLANTEPVEGYIDANDYFCGICLNPGENSIPMDNPKLDSPPHCASCGIPLKCQLTPDGVEYIKEAITEENGCCQELWPVLFADYFD